MEIQKQKKCIKFKNNMISEDKKKSLMEDFQHQSLQELIMLEGKIHMIQSCLRQ